MSFGASYERCVNDIPKMSWDHAKSSGLLVPAIVDADHKEWESQEHAVQERNAKINAAEAAATKQQAAGQDDEVDQVAAEEATLSASEKAAAEKAKAKQDALLKKKLDRERALKIKKMGEEAFLQMEREAELKRQAEEMQRQAEIEEQRQAQENLKSTWRQQQVNIFAQSIWATALTRVYLRMKWSEHSFLWQHIDNRAQQFLTQSGVLCCLCPMFCVSTNPLRLARPAFFTGAVSAVPNLVQTAGNYLEEVFKGTYFVQNLFILSSFI